MDGTYGISKSRYCRGFQCPKMLWLESNKPELSQGEISDTILANGKLVGDLAQNYFGECEIVEFDYEKSNMVLRTAQLMDAGAENIAEASFSYDGLYCAVDILHKDEDGWDIVEVKSSTHIAPIYIEDMAFQLYVLEQCGVNVKRVYNMHLDNTYVRHGELDLQGLFALEDCTGDVKLRAFDVADNIKSIREYMCQSEEPAKDIDICCDSPYECSFKNYCWRNIPKPSVFDISRLKAETKYDLYHKGIVSFDDVLDHQIKLSAKQILQVQTAAEHLPDRIDENAIIEFLNTLTYPIYHLDFETFQQAVPEFEGGTPYAQIPFQYSLHIEYRDGHLEHKEFLAKEGTDPRRDLAESLCNDIPMGVCSLAYNMAFERTVILKLAETYPDLADHLIDIRENMHDLMIPFSKGDYYCEAMQGSYSIKYVLPALYPDDPELDYHNLEDVHNGSEASAAFATMADHTPEEIEKLRANLLKYCGLDTCAMVKVLAKLREIVE